MRPTLLLTALLVAGCGATVFQVAETPRGEPIHQITLRWSNSFLIGGAHPVLIDAGSPGDLDDLTEALGDLGVEPADLAMIVLTHGHADHAGTVAELQRLTKAPVLIGAGDVEMVARGEDDPLEPTSRFAALIALVVPTTCEPFTAPVELAEPMRLDDLGIDGTLEPVAGHTPGSLVLRLDNGVVLVGDMILGGWLGGAIAPEIPGEHYFHADRAQNRENIARMLKRGARLFLVGHGGPIEAWRVRGAPKEAGLRE